jgi:hypothetical protein
MDQLTERLHRFAAGFFGQLDRPLHSEAKTGHFRANNLHFGKLKSNSF